MEESPSGSTVKKKRPQPKTSRPKKKKTDVADPGGGGDGTAPELGIFVDNWKSFVITYSYSDKHLRMVCHLSDLLTKVGLKLQHFIGPFQEFLVQQKKVQKNRSRQQKIRAKMDRSQMQFQVSPKKSVEMCVSII